jgi:hypothetical protein
LADLVLPEQFAPPPRDVSEAPDPKGFGERTLFDGLADAPPAAQVRRKTAQPPQESRDRAHDADRHALDSALDAVRGRLGRDAIRRGRDMFRRRRS